MISTRISTALWLEVGFAWTRVNELELGQVGWKEGGRGREGLFELVKITSA